MTAVNWKAIPALTERRYRTRAAARQPTPKNDFAVLDFAPSKNFHSTLFFIEPLADFDILYSEMKSKTYSFNDRKSAPDLNV